MNDARCWVIAATLLFAGTAAADCDSLSRVEWLLGHWVSETGATESWKWVADRTYEGHGSDGKDSEALRLVEMAGEVFYIAKVAHNDMPVPFKLTVCEGDTLVFENPAHDFPRRIEYRAHDETRLTVLVSDGGERGFELKFNKH